MSEYQQIIHDLKHSRYITQDIIISAIDAIEELMAENEQLREALCAYQREEKASDAITRTACGGE